MTALKIRLNGADEEVNDGMTITGLIEMLELNPKSVAVERNLEIVPKSRHGSTELKPDDRI